MRYLSVCSGIEAASQAWGGLGWKPVAFSEIERFPSAVLAHHYPTVPNWGDMTKFQEWPDADVDVLAGGTPCQSFSVAGLRKGLADPRGNLMLTYLAIADRYRPQWLVWENVPGVLSSNGGRDFAAFLGGLGQLGYGFAYRVLDAQHVRTRRFPFAVPQRRRRVWVVGYLGDWRRAAAVLFDRESLSGHPPPRREAGQGFARGIEFGPQGGGFAAVSPTLDTRAKDGPIRNQLAPAALVANSGEIGYCLTASAQNSLDAETETLLAVAQTLRGEGFDASEDGTGRQNLVPITIMQRGRDDGPSIEWRQDGTANALLTPNGGRAGMGVGCIAAPVAFDLNQITSKTNRSNPDPAVHHTLPATSCPPHLATPWAVRRLTPVECERLMGFPQVSERVIFSAWLEGKSQLSADAAIQCITWQSSASIAEEKGCPQLAKTATAHSSTSQAGRVPPVALHVQADLEQGAVRILKAGKLIWSANTADQSSEYLLSMPAGDFARLVALTTQTAAKLIPDGRVVSRTTERLSSHLWSGRTFVGLSGREIKEHAAVAERFTVGGWKPSMLTTSPSIANIPTSVSALTTLCCCVANAIASCIPETIGSGSSYSLSIETVSGFTAIPWRGKPADQCPDGPRYKALGNSWAVNCAEWVGERIAMVSAQEAAA